MPSKTKFEGQQRQQEPISLELACSALKELWSPRIVGQVNSQYIKVVKVQGEFPWHSHEHEDEMFLVLRGLLRIGRAERMAVLYPYALASSSSFLAESVTTPPPPKRLGSPSSKL